MKTTRNLVLLTLLASMLFCCNKESRKSNALINETSPYLKQHAYNPVNWKPWNEKTLNEASKENKLMVISIGYSACHWCHVMEEESFENDSIAEIMNRNFINIKVDREERPDIDHAYMTAVQLMTGSGGWPLNCITLPDGRPIFGGTYFTKKQWKKILVDLSKLYKEDPKKAIEFASKLEQGIKDAELITINTKESQFKNEFITHAIKTWKTNLDFDYGGVKGSQKFPMPSQLSYLLRYAHQFNDDTISKYVNTTLTKMAQGGIYDHIGGGFSRYTVDEKWQIPHFEKMLYDNAQLVSLYSKAYQKFRTPLYKQVVDETLKFIDRELTAESNGFYASIDADSNNEKNIKEEGTYYVWTEQELKKYLNEDFELFKSYFQCKPEKIWENNTFILHKDQSIDAFCLSNNISKTDLKQKIKRWKNLLYEVRSRRVKPDIDHKILTSWNALMISGYVDAYKALNNKSYLDQAIKSAELILSNQPKDEGKLYRNFINDKHNIPAYAIDYAAVSKAFIDLYEITLNEFWLNKSMHYTTYLFEHFFNSKSGMFYFNEKDDNSLFTKKTEIVDGVIPASNSIIADNLFKLSQYYTDKKLAATSKQMLNNVLNDLEESPSSYANWFHVMTNFTKPFYEVAIASNNLVALSEELQHDYHPNILVAGTESLETKIPLLKEKFYEGETLIYVCTDGHCKMPENNLKNALRGIKL